MVLGSGGSRGWPEPGCPCASCATAVAQRRSRSPVAALVDDVLLLDGGDDVGPAAARAGRSLAGVRHVLLTGAGPGGPVTALDGRTEVLGPPAALDRLAHRAGARAVRPGDVVDAGTHELRALDQPDGLAWEVVGRDGARLLHAPGPVALDPPPTAGRPYEVLLLGGWGWPGGGAARTLAGLRGTGAVTDRTQVVAVGLGHDDGPPDQVERRLRSWGVRDLPAGSAVGQPPGPDTAPVVGGRTLVLGGVRSGKSALAEQLLAACPRVTYVATGGSGRDDPEWQQRVAAHVARRPGHWTTVETTDVAGWLREAEQPVLIDCLGTWLTARLDRHEVWQGGPVEAVEAEVRELVAAWRAAAVPAVAVSNEVGSGVVPASASGRLFRDLLGRVNAAVAAQSETVLLTVAGTVLPLREPGRP